MVQAIVLLESILFGAFVCLAIKCYALVKQGKAMRKMVSSIPGPTGLPIIGIALKLLNKRDSFAYFMTLTKEFGSPFKFFHGPVNLVVGVNTPEDVKIILSSENSLNKSFVYKYLKLNNALFVADQEIWRVHRKILTPAFNKNMIISAIPVINKTAQRLRKRLDKKVGEPDFDWLRYITIMVLETTFENILGIEADDKNVPMLTKYMEDSIVLSNCSVERMTVPYLHPDLFYRFSKCHQIEKKVNVEIEEFFGSVLDKKLCERSELCNSNIDDDCKPNQKFIDLLLKEGNNFTYEEKRDHMRAIVYGGADTSSFTVSTALLMIAMHKDVQDKAFAEINNCLPVPDQPIDLYAVNQMSYLEQVVKEVMRLFPAAGIVGREATGDVELGNYTIPKGTTISINVLELHKSPLIWGEDAHRFNPEHFNPERLTDIHSSAYQPFTNGPRICLAYKYAMIFLKLVLADLLRNYELETTLKYDELEVDFSVLLKIQQGHKLRIKKRII